MEVKYFLLLHWLTAPPAMFVCGSEVRTGEFAGNSYLFQQI